MIDVKHCKDCRDDFYNGHNQYGVTECWSRKKATLVTRLLIHIDQPPPYLNVTPQTVPSCYRKDRFVTVNPQRIDSRGYWA